MGTFWIIDEKCAKSKTDVCILSTHSLHLQRLKEREWGVRVGEGQGGGRGRDDIDILKQEYHTRALHD